MGTVEVTYKSGDRFAAQVRGHVLYVDQPVDDGGEDSGPAPLELFIASLATCVGHYARRYLRRHELPTEGLAVTADWTMTSGPARVGGIDIKLTVPEGVPADRLDALLAVASHCTVHNTLMQAPSVNVTLTT